VYEAFKNSQEIADVINRSQSYVKKALRDGFTDREQKMLEQYAGRDLFNA
jgi:predicted transcriptional regulator